MHALKLLRRAFNTDASWGLPEASTPGGDEDDRGWSMDTQETVATVSVVGVPGWNEVGIASHTFSALGKHGVRVIAVAQAATQDSVSFCIPADQVTETVRSLHREFGPENLS